MRIADVKEIARKLYADFSRTRVTSVGAGLAFFFLLALVPLLLAAATLLGFLPVPNLFDRGIDLMARFVPEEAMGMVRDTLSGILSARHGGLLSLGILGTLWSASGGFSSMIDALDIAYDAQRSRPYIKQRLLAVVLTFVVGGLFTVGLVASVLGPEFGNWLTTMLHLNGLFARLWPLIRWGAMLISVIVAIELRYYLGPNVKQRFRNTLPGAVVATVIWLLASTLLGIYISHFGNYNKTYGSLGAVIALMLWLWVTSMILIVGAELNSALHRNRGIRLEGQRTVESPQEVEMARPRKAA